MVAGPCDSVTVTDGAALSAFQYFENVRNFLVAVEEMGLPTFEASDLGQVKVEDLANIHHHWRKLYFLYDICAFLQFSGREICSGSELCIST